MNQKLLMRDLRQTKNEDHGLYCYGCESNPREWSLWRDEGDVQLTEWRDLGPDGFIWVEGVDGDELFIVLEHRDDAANPPVFRQGLLHLPSGKETGLIFVGDYYGHYIGIERLTMGSDELLFVAYPHDTAQAHGMTLYDRHLRQVLPPIVRAISAGCEHAGLLELLINQEGGSVAWAVYDYKNMRYVMPAEYEKIFFHGGRWIGNTTTGQCHIRLVDGTLLASYDYTLHFTGGDEALGLYVERQGLWGRADAEGRIVVEPYAASWEALAAEALTFSRLTLTGRKRQAASISDNDLKKLIDQMGETGFCVKYEGIDLDGFGDGYVDISFAELPEEGRALLLNDRYGDVRLLVLTAPWRKLSAGCVLKFRDENNVSVVLEDNEEYEFLVSILAQSIGWL